MTAAAIDWFLLEDGVLNRLRTGDTIVVEPPTDPVSRDSYPITTYFPIDDPAKWPAPAGNPDNAYPAPPGGIRPLLPNMTGPTAADADLDFVDGDLTVLKNGAVIKDVYVNGQVKLGSFSNVELTNGVARGPAARGVSTAIVDGSGSNLRDVVMTDFRLEGNGNPWVDGLRGVNWHAKRVEILNTYDAIDCLGVAGNIDFLGGYVHGGHMWEWEQELATSYGNGTYQSTPSSTIPARSFAGGAIASGSKIFNSTSASFVNKDTNRTITVTGAGTGGANLVTTIATVVSATQAILTTAASTTVSAAATTLAQRQWGFYSHNDCIQTWRGTKCNFIGSTFGGMRVPGDHNVYPSEMAAINSGDDYYNSGILLNQVYAFTAADMSNKITGWRLEDNLWIGGNASMNVTANVPAGSLPNDFAGVTILRNYFMRSTWGIQYYILLSPGLAHTNATLQQSNFMYPDGAPVVITKGA